MKRKFVGFFLLWVTPFVIKEIVSGFENTLQVYSMFYPDILIQPDTLTNLNYIHLGGVNRNEITVYEGRLVKSSKKAELRIFPDPDCDSIAVWCFTKTRNILPRSTIHFPSPFYYWRSWFGLFIHLLWLPLLLYYLKVKRK